MRDCPVSGSKMLFANSTCSGMSALSLHRRMFATACAVFVNRSVAMLCSRVRNRARLSAVVVDVTLFAVANGLSMIAIFFVKVLLIDRVVTRSVA